MPIYSKDSSAICMVFLEFVHVLWEWTKPTIVLTDINLVIRFFRTKAVPPQLWNACDYVLQLNFKIYHIAGSVNTAADFLSILKLKIAEKMRLEILGEIQTTPNEVTKSSSDTADDKQFFSTRTNNDKESEKGTLQREKQYRQDTKCLGSKWGTILGKKLYKQFTKTDRQTIHKEHYVVFCEWNQSKCTNTNEARCRSSFEEVKIECSRPTLWWSSTGNRRTKQALQSNLGSHNPQRWPTVPEEMRRNWQRQTVPKSHSKAVCWWSTPEPALWVW